MARVVGEVAATVIVVMAIVSVASILRRGRSGFWIGFVVVGWSWLAISLVSPLGPDLPETGWIDALRSRIAPDQAAVPPYDFLEKTRLRRLDQLDRDAYRTAGHSVVSLVLASLCGAATRRLIAVDDRGPADWRTPDGSLFRPKPEDDRDSP